MSQEPITSTAIATQLKTMVALSLNNPYCQ